MFRGTIRHDVPTLLKVLRKLGMPAAQLLAYETGPTGYGLYRRLVQEGYFCRVVAPSLIPQRAGDRIKTDQRDSARLAELLRAGELKAIWIPDVEHEALRNLWRAREDAMQMRLKARQQVKALLLRHGRIYAGKKSWSKPHVRWLADQSFEHAGDQLAFSHRQAAARRSAMSGPMNNRVLQSDLPLPFWNMTIRPSTCSVTRAAQMVGL